MTEAIERLEQKHMEARGLVLVAKGERFAIYDDARAGLAVVQIFERKVKEIGQEGKKKRKQVYELHNIELERPKRKLQWKLIEFAVKSLPKKKEFISFALKNRSIMALVEHFYRYRSRSQASTRVYIGNIKRFSDYLKKTPDEIIASCLYKDGTPNPKKVHGMSKIIDQYLGELEAEELAPGTLLMESARLKTFFKVNGVQITLPARYTLRGKYEDRAPTVEELRELVKLAPLREKALILMLATSGLRISTLLSLKYRHVKEDLEAGRTPVHIHIEARITKGKYADYDTFINEEAAHYLKLYLEERKRGTRRIPPEKITDESPLFRTYSKRVKPLSYEQVKHEWHKLLKKAGLDEKNGKFYKLRIHSLRKFFRTQLAALGVPTDYIEYMMGHKRDTYNKIETKGVEFLRAIYASANLRIFPREKTLADVLKEIIRARGEDPAKYLKEEVMSGRTKISEQEETEIYARAIWEMLRRDLLENLSGELKTDDQDISINFKSGAS